MLEAVLFQDQTDNLFKVYLILVSGAGESMIRRVRKIEKKSLVQEDKCKEFSLVLHLIPLAHIYLYLVSSEYYFSKIKRNIHQHSLYSSLISFHSGNDFFI